MAEASAEILRESFEGGALLRVIGTINDHFEGTKLLQAAAPCVLIDLDGVRRVTSYGVREWLRAIRQVQADYLGLLKCRPPIIAQLNSVMGFAGKGQVLSIYLPYLCRACGAEQEVLVDLRKDFDRVGEIAEAVATCGTCGKEAEFDDVPQAYLAFLGKVSRPEPPPAVNALLDGTPLAPRYFELVKEVDSEFTVLRISGRFDQTSRLKRQVDGLEGAVVVVSSDLTGIHPEAQAAFLELFSSAEADYYLVGAPEVLIELLSRPEAQGRRLHLVSLQMRWQCGSCGLTTTEVVSSKEIHGGGQGERACARCSGRLTSQPLSPQVDEAAKRLGADIPEALRASVDQVARGVSSDEAPTGSDRFGRYQILRRLGTGGMAEVDLAYQSGTGGFQKMIVIKRILPHLCKDAAFVSMFLQEARLAARIDHPNVVQIFDVGDVSGRHFISMEYVRGPDLNVVLFLVRGLKMQVPVRLALRVMADVCAGLHAAHSCVSDNGVVEPIVHRDVSPHNILISDRGQVKLADFGIAKASDNMTVTPTSEVKGKRHYLAPEQIIGGTPIGPWVDIFAAAAVLFEILTGQRLFDGGGAVSVIQNILHKEIPDVRQLRPDVPADLAAAVQQALQRDPSRRQASAQALHQQLDSVAAALGPPVTHEELAAWLNEIMALARAQGGELELAASGGSSVTVTARKKGDLTPVLPNRSPK